MTILPRITIWLLITMLVLISILLLYSNRTARSLRAEIRDYDRVISEEQEALLLLRLEMNHLSHPRRLEALAALYLPELVPVLPEQMYTVPPVPPVSDTAQASEPPQPIESQPVGIGINTSITPLTRGVFVSP